jgi:hypothetical protein
MSYLFMAMWVLLKLFFWLCIGLLIADSIITHLANRKLWKEYEDLYKKYKEKCIEIEGLRIINKACIDEVKNTIIKFEELKPTNAEDAYEQARGDDGTK